MIKNKIYKKGYSYVVPKNQKKYKEEEEGIRTEELNWFYRIITLGDRFSWKDFYDRLKKQFLTF